MLFLIYYLIAEYWISQTCLNSQEGKKTQKPLTISLQPVVTMTINTVS